MTKDDIPPHADIGLRLKSLRSFLGLTQKEFAEKHKFPRTRYNHWERGVRRISLDCAYVLRDQYGITLDFIYLGKDAALPANLRTAFASMPLSTQSNQSKDTPDD